MPSRWQTDFLMRSLAARPCNPALTPFIVSFHYHESEMPLCLERIVPNGQAHLMVNLREDVFRTYSGPLSEKVSRMRGSVLAGPHAQATVIDTSEQCWLVAAEFKPGGAAAFFKTPIHEVLDDIVDIEDLWGRDGAVLRDQLLETVTPHGKFQLLEAALLRQLRRLRDPAIMFAISALEKGVSVVGPDRGRSPAYISRLIRKVGSVPRDRLHCRPSGIFEYTHVSTDFWESRLKHDRPLE